jgi:hypothetical protein
MVSRKCLDQVHDMASVPEAIATEYDANSAAVVDY